jgi:hypothetical protein
MTLTENGSHVGPNGRVATGSMYKEIGMSGLVWTGGGGFSYVDEEFLVNLFGRRAIQIYKEMSWNDPTVGSILFTIEALMRQVEWETEPNMDADDPEGDAEFVQSCMDDMAHTWVDHLGEVLTMLPYGWSWFETVYKKRSGYKSESNKMPSSKYNDGKIGWRKFAFRAQESIDHWVFDEDDGSVMAYVQRPAPKYEPLTIPIQKSLLFRTTTNKNNPEGKSMIRNAYRPWFYKKAMEDIEAIGVERDLAGLPVAYVDPDILLPNAPPEAKLLLTAINNIVKGIKRNKNEGVVWPRKYDADGHSLYDLELLSSGGSRQFNTNQIIDRYDQRIAMTVLADFLLLGHENVGSFALSSDKTDLFAVALGSILDSIQEVYNQYALPRLYALNGMDTTTMCKIRHGDIHSPELADLAAYLTALGTIGIPLMPNADLLTYLMKAANLPAPSEEQLARMAQATGPTQPINPDSSQQQNMMQQVGFKNAPGDNGPNQGNSGGQASPGGQGSNSGQQAQAESDAGSGSAGSS